MSNFGSNPWTCGPVMFPTKNSSNSGKNNCIFPGTMREDRALVLTYLVGPIDKPFS